MPAAGGGEVGPCGRWGQGALEGLGVFTHTAPGAQHRLSGFELS